MGQIIDSLWRLPRDIVSNGYDAALRALATQLPMTIHEYPTGMEAWTWVVPEKWTCHEAYLETLDGRRLFSYADHPLHVVSYSLPFEGVVSREELLAHLHAHPRIPDAVPFIFKYYERDWGLCCSQLQRERADGGPVSRRDPDELFLRNAQGGGDRRAGGERRTAWSSRAISATRTWSTTT